MGEGAAVAVEGDVAAGPAGHMAPSDRKQKETEAGAQPTFSFIFGLRPQATKGAAHSYGFPLQ